MFVSSVIMREPLSCRRGLIISSISPFNIFGQNFITSILVIISFLKGLVMSVSFDIGKH